MGKKPYTNMKFIVGGTHENDEKNTDTSYGDNLGVCRVAIGGAQCGGCGRAFNHRISFYDAYRRICRDIHGCVYCHGRTCADHTKTYGDAKITWNDAAKRLDIAAGLTIVLGYGDGKFGPEDSATKEQLTVIVYRMQQSSGKIPPDVLMNREWSDGDSIKDWAKPAVNALTMQGVFGDISGVSFNPQTSATRAEAVSILHRWLTAAE